MPAGHITEAASSLRDLTAVCEVGTR